MVPTKTALMTEPIVKPAWNGGRYIASKDEAYFYKVSDGENWGKVAAKDGWSDVKAFIKWNFGTDNPYEVNWFLKNYVGCKLRTDDGKNYRFSSAASPGYIFTRKNWQPWNQPSGNIPAPQIPTDQDGPIILEAPYGPPKPWVCVGMKGGGMAGKKGADVYGLIGVSLDTEFDAFVAGAYTQRDGFGLGMAGGFCVGIVSHMQHPNQLFDLVSRGADAAISLGPKMGALGKLLVDSKLLYGVAQNAVELATNLVVRNGDGLSKILGALKAQGQAILGVTGAKGVFSATLLDVPFGGLGSELAVYEGVTTYRPYATLVRGKNGVESYRIGGDDRTAEQIEAAQAAGVYA